MHIEAFKVPVRNVYTCATFFWLVHSRVVSAYIQGRFRRNCALSLSLARERYILDVAPAFGEKRKGKAYGSVGINAWADFGAGDWDYRLLFC